MSNQKKVLRLWVSTLAVLSAACALLSWYGMVVWGYWASYVSARPPSASTAELRPASLRGTLGFSAMIIGQIALVGLVLVYCRKLEHLSGGGSPRVGKIVGVAVVVLIDVGVFITLFAIQANS